MPIDPTNARELATIVCEIGGEVVEGNLRYPSETASWQLGEVAPQASSSVAASCIRFQAAST